MFRLYAAVVFSLVCLLSPDARSEPVVLKGDRWNVSVDPGRLRVTGHPADGSAPIVISAARQTPPAAAELKHDGRQATWTLPAENLSVTMRLDADVLAVDFVASRAGALTWPVVDAESTPRAYILPMFEGLYVPADDRAWQTWLLHQGPVNTTAGLSLPFWGLDHGAHTLTYVLTNPYNNEIEFLGGEGPTGMRLTHAFTRNNDVKQYGLRIHLADGSPVTPAKVYRQHLVDTKQFVSLREKIERTPDAAKLLGAPHIYLWGDGLIARKDVRDYKKLAAALVAAGSSDQPSVGRRVWELTGDDARKLLEGLPKAEFVDNFQKGQVVEELSRVLKAADITPASFHAAFPDLLVPVGQWGDGYSLPMLKALADAGIDRAWLGSPNWDGLGDHPQFVKEAVARGYLVGPYDSFHSIHPHGLADTWETAQFDDPALFESGAIVKADGSKRKGFKQKGHLLSPAAARPHVEARVSKRAQQFRCNSWFIDCDAFGEVFDDYAPGHPMTQAQDAAERVDRMKWIRDTFGAVIGSEGGSAYAAPVVHFAHGVMTPVIAWGDPDLMKDKKSRYYLGGYYPPDGPAIFFKQVPMKDEHRRVYADPRFRLPLYQTVFHDSLVATHQWGYGSLKFDDPGRTRELLELLYNVPPLYHLNLAEWTKRKEQITKHFEFFSPLHREAGLLPMTDFRWLSDDRMVQQTTFGDGKLVLTANFGDTTFVRDGIELPAHSIVARRAGSDARALYPGP